MTRMLVILCAVMLLAGCGEESSFVPHPTTHTTPSGVPVYIPEWLSGRDVTKTALVLIEIDAETIPSGWVVVVELPVYVVSYRDMRPEANEPFPRPGLVRGHTDYDRREIHAGWRGPGEAPSPLLPALAWECANARQDPGHHDPFGR